MENGVKRITVASGQILCEVGNVEHNLRQIETMARTVAAQGARLMLCAEGALTGYLLTDEVFATAPDAGAAPVQRLRELSRELDMAIVVGSLAHSPEGRRVSAFIALPDGQLLVQQKHKLTPKELAAKVVPGPEERIVFEVDGVRCAVCICADSGIENIYNKLAAKGCQIYLGPTAGGAGRDDMCTEVDLDSVEGMNAYVSRMEKVCFLGHAMRQCRQHRMALVCCNLAGDDGMSNYHPGHSSIVDARGRSVGLIPGEYVREWLRPRWLCEEIVVDQPRQA